MEEVLATFTLAIAELYMLVSFTPRTMQMQAWKPASTRKTFAGAAPLCTGWPIQEVKVSTNAFVLIPE